MTSRAAMVSLHAANLAGRRVLLTGASGGVVLDVSEATGQFGVIMESVGGKTFAAALAKLAPGGTVLWYGQAGLEPAVP